MTEEDCFSVFPLETLVYLTPDSEHGACLAAWVAEHPHPAALPGPLPPLILPGPMYFFPENHLSHIIFKFTDTKLISIFSFNYFTFFCNFNFDSFLNPNVDLSLLPFFLDQICQRFVYLIGLFRELASILPLFSVSSNFFYHSFLLLSLDLDFYKTDLISLAFIPSLALEDVDLNKVYILGGLVDESIQKVSTF